MAETRIFNDPPRLGRVKETEQQGAENRVNTLYNESAPLSCLWDRVLQESRQRPPVCVLHGNDSGRNRRGQFPAERKLADPPRHFADAKAYIYIYVYYNFAVSFGRDGGYDGKEKQVAWIDYIEVKFSLSKKLFSNIPFCNKRKL